MDNTYIDNIVKVGGTDCNDNLVRDYNNIMKGYDSNNPMTNQPWEMEGGLFKKFSLYDSSLECVSGIL